MLSEQTSAKTFLELAQLRDHVRAIDMPAELVEAGAETPLHLLLIRFEDDEQGRERLAHVSFVPTADDQLEAIKLLQIYVGYPWTVQPGLEGDVGRVLARLNSRLPLGSLGVADNGELCFKLVHAYPKYDLLEEEAASELVQLVQFVVGLFAAQLEDVAQGRRSANEVLDELSLQWG